MIRVLIVDDSTVQQELLNYILTSDPEIEVIGFASDGEEAVHKVAKLKPDLVTMDINMPKMSGIEAIRAIMSTNPLPIVVVSGSSTKSEISNSFQAIEAGAVSVIERTVFSAESTQSLINTIKLMSVIKVVKRHARLHSPSHNAVMNTDLQKTTKVEIIAIGSSTGGPLVLQNILQNISSPFPPILIAQHISPGFLQGLADWLAQSSKLTVKIASNNEELVPSHIYLAPDGYQMGISSLKRITLNLDKANNGYCPSISHLFSSVSKIYGARALGILLTGMGRDGADGLRTMKEAGAMTIVQDEVSAIVYGMPGEALSLNAVSKVLTPAEISSYINALKVRQP